MRLIGAGQAFGSNSPPHPGKVKPLTPGMAFQINSRLPGQKHSNARGLSEGEMLMFRIDWCIKFKKKFKVPFKRNQITKETQYKKGQLRERNVPETALKTVPVIFVFMVLFTIAVEFLCTRKTFFICSLRSHQVKAKLYILKCFIQFVQNYNKGKTTATNQ